MDDRWPGSPPMPPEQPAGDWGAPAAGPGPAFPPYLPPPTPPAAEPPAEPVAEPGWAWRTSRSAPPPEQTWEPEHHRYGDQYYDHRAYGGQPQYAEPQYAEPPYGEPQYGEPQYGEPPYAERQYGEPQYDRRAYQEPDPADRWREPAPDRPAAGAGRAPRTAGEPLSEPPPEPLDEPAPARPGLVGTLLWTLGAFLLPLLVYLGWTATLGTTPRPGCVDVAGGPCPGPRAQAVTNLLNVLPAVVVALGAALLLALGIRYIAVTWRSYKVAFAASVIGAGATTLLVSALS